MQIYWNKRKRLHRKRVQLPEDWFGTPTRLPFHCFGTPIWPPWRHVKTLYSSCCHVHFLVRKHLSHFIEFPNCFWYTKVCTTALIFLTERLAKVCELWYILRHISPIENNEVKLASSSLLNTWVFVFGKEMVMLSPKREQVSFRMFMMVFTSAIILQNSTRSSA